MSRPLRPADILGVPFTPPHPAMNGIRGLRKWLMRARRRTAFPPEALFEGVFAVFDHRVLGLLVQFGIPDHLRRPRTAAELAEVISVDPTALDRILRYAASRGYVSARRGDRYGSSPITELLRSDHPNSWANWVRRVNSDWLWQPLIFLDEMLGVSHQWPAHDNSVDVDSVGSAIQAFALCRGVPWRGVSTVCDVGGGHGVVLEVILDAMPDLRGILFDRPAVVARARSELVSGRLASRCEVMGGDFLSEVPRGADCYLLLAIMTLFDDPGAVAVLSAVRDAMGPDARLLVVDNQLSRRPTDEPAQTTDLLLLTMGAGHERTRPEYDRLFADAGLALNRAHPLLSGSTAFEVRRATASD